MKKLFLIRHAKSDWSNAQLTDFERPLNDRGRRDAPFMAQKFAERIGFVDQLISSPAERAFTTSKIFAGAMNVETNNVNLVRDIYEADITALMRVLNAIDKSVESVAMFGHNPGLSNLCYYLTNQAVHMPTCSIAELHFELNDWSMLSKETCILFNFDYPKRYQ